MSEIAKRAFCWVYGSTWRDGDRKLFLWSTLEPVQVMDAIGDGEYEVWGYESGYQVVGAADIRAMSLRGAFYKLWLALLMSGPVLMLPERLPTFVSYTQEIPWHAYPASLVVLAAVATVGLSLTKASDLMAWSWLSMVLSRPADNDEGDYTSGTNVGVAPIRYGWIGVAFGLALLVSLPEYAMWEERLFRSMTEGWVEGFAVSVIFGLAHCLVGVPLGFGFALSIGGLWFTHHYFIGGVEQAALYHTAYNLTVLAPALLVFALKALFGPPPVPG